MRERPDMCRAALTETGRVRRQGLTDGNAVPTERFG